MREAGGVEPGWVLEDDRWCLDCTWHDALHGSAANPVRIPVVQYVEKNLEMPVFVPSDSAVDKRLATGGAWEPVQQKPLGSQPASSEMVASKIPEKRGHTLIAKHEGVKSCVATKTNSKESREMNYNAGTVAADETDAKNNQHAGGSAGVASMGVRCFLFFI